MLKEFKKAFTLAEVLIVIGIIGVVAALTLPNLNHATGDKETVTRLQKAYSILNEANDRAVAIYGPISTWSEECRDELDNCWLKRISEFLKISKSCDETLNEEDLRYSSCDSLIDIDGHMSHSGVVFQMPDGITVTTGGGFQENCLSWGGMFNDICLEIDVDINGPNKGKNKYGVDEFHFMLSNSNGLLPYENSGATEENFIEDCIADKSEPCTWWVLEYGNLDYLKADSTGKCNDSNIILDGVTNTSCH